MVDTYIDPKTGTAYDFGVQSFLGVGNATGFFERFGIELAPFARANVTTEYIDFNTGSPVNYETPTMEAQMAAMEKFLNVVEPWTEYLQPGYWNFPQPADMPEDFLVTFGMGNMTRQTTMFELQAFGTYMAEAMLGKMGSYHVSSGGNQALYNAIAKDLGDDVLYSSTVIDTRRTDSGVFLTVKNRATGKVTRITARQLLVAIEPTEENTAVLNLSQHEQTTLSKSSYTREYTGILNNTALEAGKSYFNIPSASAPDNHLVLPDFPHIVGDDTLDEASAKALVQKNFNAMIRSGHLAGSEIRELNWVDFSVHGPMHARVFVEDIQDGFFQQLYKMQGERSTWWTGGAFARNFQTTLWQFDESLIPRILERLS
ncbi:hypothetical protein PHISCL_08110 [Aspergillus sclerotialis]|uniref:Amine oxidase domain-containing protein n=1 Tax=Aspergillus sclerotialis TaxID=2070753 RepID=A0A3A2ZNW5_9EURO|nr:hypothetical protein PHISCL_08110 [Aspergillus sclerotialis]